MKKKLKPAKKESVGRPSKYNKELFDKICTEIATSSKGLKIICEKHKVSAVTFYAWIREDEELLNTYTRAREDQADLLADEMLAIADKSDGDDKAFVGINRIHRDKLRLETRKWIASKLKPKKYGDKLDMTTDGDKISNVKVTVIQSPAPLASNEKDVSLE